MKVSPTPKNNRHPETVHTYRHGAGMVAIAVFSGGRPDCRHYYMHSVTDADGWQHFRCRRCGQRYRTNPWVHPSEYAQYGIETAFKVSRKKGKNW